MVLDFEYGLEKMSASLPDSTDVFIAGETVKDPQCLPQNYQDLYNATLKSVRNPIGMNPIDSLVNSESKVTIVIPDIVKGGTQPTSHRKISVRVILDELYRCGVKKDNILLIFSNGLHPRTNKLEALQILGEEIFNEFDSCHQIISHDSEDIDNIVDLGTDELGDYVFINRYVYESDLAVLIGHVQGNPYGGYSGGYKHCATGISNWKSISSHHIPQVMHKPDFVPVSSKSEMRKRFDAIGQHMEKCMGKKFFCCDAVLDTFSRQISIYSGYAKEMQSISWADADKRTYVPFADKQYDILVFGMPRDFHYGPGMGTNPIQLMQALSAQVIRHKRVMKDNCVIICSSICDGWFNDERWPYAREVFDLYASCATLPEMAKYADEFAQRQDYIDKYRFEGAFHPYHAFSMMSCGHIAETNTSAIYIVGAKEPGIARAMGLKTANTFEQALEDAEKKYTGSNPSILALPQAFTRGAVHLCLK